MSEQFSEINIKDIDLNDLRYKISYSSDNIESLARSIKKIGLINPPLVRPFNKKYIIVSGFNRIKASIFNHNDTITVYKTYLDENDYQCLVKSITALSFQRQLTQAELIICIKRLNNFMDTKSIAHTSAAIFNTQFNSRFIKNLSDIGNLPDPALKLIHQGNLSFKTATKLLMFKEDIIINFLNLFSKIKASSNKQLEIMQYMMEISKRDNINPNFFFQNQKIKEIVFDQNKEPILKTRLLREYLYSHRFPTLFQTSKTVQKQINNLKLGKKIKFLPPENFESQNFIVSFTAKNYKDFKTNTKILNNLLENKELKKIFKI